MIEMAIYSIGALLIFFISIQYTLHKKLYELTSREKARMTREMVSTIT